MNPLQLQQSVQRVTPAVRDTDPYFIWVLSRHVTLCALLGVIFVATCHALSRGGRCVTGRDKCHAPSRHVTLSGFRQHRKSRQTGTGNHHEHDRLKNSHRLRAVY